MLCTGSALSGLGRVTNMQQPCHLHNAFSKIGHYFPSKQANTLLHQQILHAQMTEGKLPYLVQIARGLEAELQSQGLRLQGGLV